MAIYGSCCQSTKCEVIDWIKATTYEAHVYCDISFKCHLCSALSDHDSTRVLKTALRVRPLSQEVHFFQPTGRQCLSQTTQLFVLLKPF